MNAKSVKIDHLKSGCRGGFTGCEAEIRKKYRIKDAKLKKKPQRASSVCSLLERRLPGRRRQEGGGSWRLPVCRQEREREREREGDECR